MNKEQPLQLISNQAGAKPIQLIRVSLLTLTRAVKVVTYLLRQIGHTPTSFRSNLNSYCLGNKLTIFLPDHEPFQLDLDRSLYAALR